MLVSFFFFLLVVLAFELRAMPQSLFGLVIFQVRTCTFAEVWL
jgi:hypothetical protein